MRARAKAREKQSTSGNRKCRLLSAFCFPFPSIFCVGSPSKGAEVKSLLFTFSAFLPPETTGHDTSLTYGLLLRLPCLFVYLHKCFIFGPNFVRP